MNPLIPAIIGSIIDSAGERLMAPPVVVPPHQQGIFRVLPQEALRGIMSPPVQGMVEIDGKPVPLSPAVQIRDPMNMVVMPMMIQGRVPVRYLTDTNGAVFRVWILSAQEAAQPYPNPK